MSLQLINALNKNKGLEQKIAPVSQELETFEVGKPVDRMSAQEFERYIKNEAMEQFGQGTYTDISSQNIGDAFDLNATRVYKVLKNGVPVVDVMYSAKNGNVTVDVENRNCPKFR
ncbi:MAG: hypothetical protein JW791_05330 [Nanoarchaeota archaeon]|nr:hypothetical protein [Nanoarchaeota archaeon]